MKTLKSEREHLAHLERLHREKKFEEFLILAEKIIEDFSESFHIRFLYARVLKELKRLSESELILKDLSISYPDNINLLLEMGSLLVEYGKFDEAAACFNKILFLDPFNTGAREFLEKINLLKKSPSVAGQKSPGFLAYEAGKPKTEAARAQASPKPPPIPEIEDEIPEPISPVPPVPPPQRKPGVPPSARTPIVPDLGHRSSPPPPAKPPPQQEIKAPPSTRAEYAAFKEDTLTEEDLPSVPDLEEERPPVPGPGHGEFIDEDTIAGTAEPAPAEKEKGEVVGGAGFMTESAAELYITQGLYDDALTVYKKLYSERKEERYLLKVKEVMQKKINQRKIQVLSLFLRLIERKGESVV